MRSSLRLKPEFDILGLGAVSVDELIYAESYPPADVKTRVLGTDRQCGGLAAAALIAASRLGSKCAYAGVLGEDELSQFAIQQMQSERINLKYLQKNRDARPGHSFIVIDSTKGTRNVFSQSANNVSQSEMWPEENIIRRTRILLVDHKEVTGMIRAARIARTAGIPVVADFERETGPEFPELLGLADHLILSQAFAEKLTGEKKPDVAAQALWNQARKVVAITRGEKGCWFLTGASRKAQHQPAFRVNTVDTTGCGDVFHGAYASAIARRKSVEEALRFASAAAALKATRNGIPTLSAVQKFLKLNK